MDDSYRRKNEHPAKASVSDMLGAEESTREPSSNAENEEKQILDDNGN